MRKRLKILQWFKNQKLGRKILYTFVLATGIPLLIAQALMLYVVSNNLKEKVDELMYSQLVQISERTNLTLDIYTNLVYQIYSDSQVVNKISEYGTSDAQEKVRLYKEINDQLQQYGIAASGIECISIIMTDGQDITYDFRLASAIDNLWGNYSDKTKTEPYIQAIGASNMVISPTQSYDRGDEEIRIFHISKRMFDLDNLSKGTIATVVMSVNESVLNEVCTAVRDDNTEQYMINFITDQERNVLTYPDSFYSGIKMDPNKTVEEFVMVTGQLKGKNCAVNQYKDEKSGWIFYNAYDEDYILKDVNNLQFLTIFIGVVLFGVALFMIRYTVVLIEKSTQSIVGGIQEVQKGNLNVHVQVECEDEMGQIADNFNTMTSKVKGLIEEVTLAVKKQKDAEIKALEAQINPHFLYNTLDSINWMAIEKREYEISNMLRNLGVILRYSISKSNQKVTITEMTDWLQKYVSLQQMRFNHSFFCDIHVEQEAKQVQIYKLIIQPFVENAIIHGFKEIESGGILRVDIMLSEDKEKLDIIIEDNGKGMSKEIVQKYNNKVAIFEDDKRSIGLCNAFTRMQMYYGDMASWNISSIPEVGTIVTLKIPAEYKE